MRIYWNALIIILSLSPIKGYGQEKVIAPDLGKMAGGKGWTLHNATPEALAVEGKSAVRLIAKGDSANGYAGLALADGVEFATGVIEIDLKGKSVRPSFLGVAFNVADEKTFEAIYFRPFNFKADGEFKNRAVQYLAWPDNTWDKLRKNQPGKYKGSVSSAPDPDKWFHARIEVGAKQVRVYVNESKEPSLTLERLAASGKKRAVGLFVDSGDGQYAGLKIIPTSK